LLIYHRVQSAARSGIAQSLNHVFEVTRQMLKQLRPLLQIASSGIAMGHHSDNHRLSEYRVLCVQHLEIFRAKQGRRQFHPRPGEHVHPRPKLASDAVTAQT
jgi:hypothetical protein